MIVSEEPMKALKLSQGQRDEIRCMEAINKKFRPKNFGSTQKGAQKKQLMPPLMRS